MGLWAKYIFCNNIYWEISAGHLNVLGSVCVFQCLAVACLINWPRGYRTFFMLNSNEHEIFPAHKC